MHPERVKATGDTPQKTLWRVPADDGKKAPRLPLNQVRDVKSLFLRRAGPTKTLGLGG